MTQLSETDRYVAARTPGLACRRSTLLVSIMLGVLLMATSIGCWAPFRSYGIPARCMPETFRTPMRTAGQPLNFSNLTVRPPEDYILGPNDVLDVTIPGLFEGAEVRPIQVQVMASGEIHLPMVGSIVVGNRNLLQTQQIINDRYEDGFLVNPRVSVALAEKSTTSVLVLGKVKKPGVHILPKFENDVGHALAAAGGLLEESAEFIEVHRRIVPGAPMPAHFGGLSPTANASINLASYSAALPAAPSRYEGVRLSYEAEPSDGESSYLPVAPRTLGVAQPYYVHENVTQPAPAGSAPRTSLFPSPDGDGHSPRVGGTNSFDLTQLPTPRVARQLEPEPVSMPAPTTLPQQGNNMSMETLSTPQPTMNPKQVHGVIQGDKQILRIPLRQVGPTNLSDTDITLQPGDVVMVPSRRNEVFYVVGRLNPINSVRFTIGDREREIGVGFILPREREIDVVTAVAMAGYIDPIDSPTTVTVHRVGPDRKPLLIHVDLIKARYDCRETVLVQPGDIIYLNPDCCWWGRRTFDRIIPDFFDAGFLKAFGFD